jgi:putative NADPH-quinone reductase
MTRTLVVICHPRHDSLTRAAAERVRLGLVSAGHDIRILDLDALDFDPRLTAFEHEHHIGDPTQRPDLADHVDALRWAQRLVLVYPTWFGGQPARLKGWFDRVWMHRVAFTLPDGAVRIRANLSDVRRIDIVTTHGSSWLVNLLQGNPGRLTVFRTLRILCHPLCRTSITALYRLDARDQAEIADWLDRVERRFAR